MNKSKIRENFEKPVVDEEYLMQIMSGEEVLPTPAEKTSESRENASSTKDGTKKSRITKKNIDYEETFLVNRFPSGRTGKVVYIRPEYHERLLRIVQLSREDKVTLYSYIDNILEYHFREFGEEITEYFNQKFKPIL